MARSLSSTRAGAPHLLAWWTLVFALICGGGLRWAWIEDMEWKDDERWSYRMSQEVGQTRPWSGTGMPTSLKFPNPGLSVWTFVAIGRVAEAPTSMAHAVVLLNMIGLIGFAAAVRVWVQPSEREPWIWGLALQAVSPYAIRLSRKIWPPSILTPLLLLLWISHRHRRSRPGAFAWGLVGALIGQVHLSGWFVSVGLVIGTLVAEFLRRLPRSHVWRWWLLGTVLGLLPAIPWLRALPAASASMSTLAGDFPGMGRAVAYLYGMIGAATSTFPFVFLGTGYDSEVFLAGPTIAGIDLHAYDLLGSFILLAFMARITARIWNFGARPVIQRVLRKIRHRTGEEMIDGKPAHAVTSDLDGQVPSLSLYLWSTIGVPSLIYLAITKVYFYHYFFVFCPFLFVLIALIMLPWRRILVGIIVAQALMTGIFLQYVHQTGGIIHGEYGVSYGRQEHR